MFQSVQKVWKRGFHKKEAVKVTREFLMILDCFLRNQDRWLSGADIMGHTGLRSGTVYPLTIRMERGEWLQCWNVTGGRRVYKLREGGVAEQAKAMLVEHTEIWQPQP